MVRPIKRAACPVNTAGVASGAELEVVDAEDERLKLDYEQTLATYRQFTEIRFKLLAFVPTLTGVAVALLTNATLDGSEQVALAGLGFFVTFGIVLYDQRNTQFYNGAIARAQYLENGLDLDRFENDQHRGLFGSRKDHRRRRLFGLPIGHDLGLAFIYSAALGAWAFAAVHGISGATWTAMSAGAGVGLLAFLQFEWLDGKPKWLSDWRERKMNEKSLASLNEMFGDAEVQRDEDFFHRVLADKLVFRRANGVRVGKEQFLRI